MSESEPESESQSEFEAELEDKNKIFNEHNGSLFILRGARVNQLVERFHWLGEPKKLPYELICRHLIHYTENESALNIGFDNPDYFSFESHKCNLFDDEENDHYFVWWAAVAPDGWDAGINRENPALSEFFATRFCNSRAFKGDSLCGPIGFQSSWKHLLRQYAASRRKHPSQIQLKTFGTFLYSREMMYAIIVCVEGDTLTYTDDEDGTQKRFSIIAPETEAYRSTNNDDTFVWKLYSTSNWNPSGNRDYPSPTWDHLSFAFYYPDRGTTLNISPHLCSIKTKQATEYRPFSRVFQRRQRTSEEIEPDFSIVQNLHDKIARQ